jgi:flavin reductase (DIM6/NTAB) family NADH-FMN oxidoreductase RutF
MHEGDKQLAAALGRIPSGIFIVTSRNGDAETGMLASWVQQCAFQPPHISLAIRQGRPLAAWLKEGAPLTINILDDSQTDMIVHFGRGFALEEPAFAGLEVERPEGGAPVLCEALAFLECRVTGHCLVGDHDVFFGQVIGGRVLGEGHPMVHIRKSGLQY